MTFVNVLVDEPVSALTYALTAAQLLEIKIGSLVIVAMRRRNMIGVVADLTKTKSHFRGKLRTVQAVLPGEVVPVEYLNLAMQLAHLGYGKPGQLLFRFLPPLSQKGNVFPTLSNVRNQGKIFHLHAHYQERIKLYAVMADKAIKTNKQVVVVSQKKVVEKIATSIKKAQSKVAVVSSNLGARQLRVIYQRFVHGQIDVVCGTRLVAAWQTKRLGLKIIDNPISISHEDSRAPYLDSATLGYLLHQKWGGNLVLGVVRPTLNMFWREERGQAQVISRSRGLHNVILSSTDFAEVKALIGRLIKSGQKTFVITPRQGLGAVAQCLACRLVQVCQQCHEPLNFAQDTNPVCYNGHKQTKLKQCADCAHDQFFFAGIGALSLQRELGFSQNLPDNLLIGTQSILCQVDQECTVVFYFADSTLMSPRLEQVERFINLIAETATLVKEVYILTHDPVNLYWQLLGEDYQKVLQTILAKRKKLQLPPFTQSLYAWGSGSLNTSQLPYGSQKLSNGRGKIETLMHVQDVRQVINLLPASWQFKKGSILFNS